MLLKLTGSAFIDGVPYTHDELSKILQEHKSLKGAESLRSAPKLTVKSDGTIAKTALGLSSAKGGADG